MRLIDAEKFEVFDATCPIPKGMRCGKTAAYFYGEGCRKVLEAIDAAPTVEPKRIKAEWVYAGEDVCNTYYECPVCESVFASCKHFKYCPECGARMVNANG